MTTNVSFEMIWEASESFFKDNPANVSSIITELMAKLSLYQNIDLNKDLSLDEKNTAKQYLMGKILQALTHLSLKDNINVYTALKSTIAATKADRLEATFKK